MNINNLHVPSIICIVTLNIFHSLFALCLLYKVTKIQINFIVLYCIGNRNIRNQEPYGENQKQLQAITKPNTMTKNADGASQN